MFYFTWNDIETNVENYGSIQFDAEKGLDKQAMISLNKQIQKWMDDR